MHTMKYNKEDRLWTVGYFEPKADETGEWHTWHPLEDYKDKQEAAAWVSYLNGGPKP